MMASPIKGVIIACTFSIISLYGTLDLFTEVIRTFFPFGIILVILLVTAIHLLRVPPPPQDVVESVLGKDLDGTTNNGYVMKTVAHRGAGLDAPENSLAAFKMCKDKGCDAVEFDVSLTADGVPIVFHDSTLERMTDRDVAIDKQKWSDLSDIDISVKHPFRDRFAKTNIPTLEQTVVQLLESGQRMFIDIKDPNTKMVKIIHDLFDKHSELCSRAVVTSFYPQIIYSIRKGNPKIVCSMAWRPDAFAYEGFNYPQGAVGRRYKSWPKHYMMCLYDKLHEWLLPRIVYYMLGLSVILLHKDVIDARSVLAWKSRGVRVMAWTVNSPAEKQYLAKVLKITYLTDTLTGEVTAHSSPI